MQWTECRSPAAGNCEKRKRRPVRSGARRSEPNQLDLTAGADLGTGSGGSRRANCGRSGEGRGLDRVALGERPGYLPQSPQGLTERRLAADEALPASPPRLGHRARLSGEGIEARGRGLGPLVDTARHYAAPLIAACSTVGGGLPTDTPRGRAQLRQTATLRLRLATERVTLSDAPRARSHEARKS